MGNLYALTIQKMLSMNRYTQYPAEGKIVAGYEISQNTDRAKALNTIKEKLQFSHCYHLNQIHSEKIVTFKKGMKPGLDGDAIICYEKNVLLGVFTADCVPVTIYSENGIGIIHAGWKGFMRGIFQHFFEKFTIRPGHIKAVIGPCICNKCYEVGYDVATHFRSECLVSINDKVYLDLKKAAWHHLIENNLLKENITISDKCTLCSKDSFHSYRRNKTPFRNINFVGKIE